jgi:hypothetical protein
MIIDDGSPFMQLPAALNRKQALFLDGIRYSVEMATLAHARLRRTLLNHTQRTVEGEPGDKQAETSAFSRTHGPS